MKRSLSIVAVLVGMLGLARAEYVQITSVMDLHTMGTDADGLDLANAFISIYPPKAGPAGQFFKMRARESNLEVPFIEGPWRGGKAIFEFPRDLSYMEVSIYDKRGDRQRLYSVRSKPYESGRLSQANTTATFAATPAVPPAVVPSPVQPVQEVRDGIYYSNRDKEKVAVAQVPKRQAVILPEPPPVQVSVLEPTEQQIRQARETERQAQRQAFEKLKTSQDVAHDVFKRDEAIDQAAPKVVDENPAPLLDPRVAKLAAATPVEKAPVVIAAPGQGMDVNDPELGVHQVNLTDKFSGGRYGRHREYERRVVYGKRPSSPVKDYDYYVDEVDRKKESHTLSYYRHEGKGKNKLVAVQSHENVTFLSNYDIADDGPAKVSTH